MKLLSWVSRSARGTLVDSSLEACTKVVFVNDNWPSATRRLRPNFAIPGLELLPCSGDGLNDTDLKQIDETTMPISGRILECEFQSEILLPLRQVQSDSPSRIPHS